ncbi:Cytochrome P450, family 87, subfamily A, polypeptide 2 [Heracleum sosnowskyi]|uniref:Cytochrome P450, family 87, subfamily A, polypeptide 2 n=1 Tax=Heracleum sosnowskyi TaxID=360622 RepID=A0AAD8HX96_9APIA|nr:Cytochrome P450, family 87, subfamily A, polypeptide 2 [Heracleum sosnowskyi]
MWSVALTVTAFLAISIVHWVYKWRNPKCNGELPPGSMGLPLLGETLQFFAPSSSSDIHPFVKERIKRYGPIFRTSLVGRSLVVTTDPELSHYVFQQEGVLFQSWYPDTFTEIFGKQNVARRHLKMWSEQDSVELKDRSATMIFDLTAKKLISHDPEKSSENLRENFVAFIKGLISFPINIPGTAYHKCLQGRKKAMKMLKQMLKERRVTPNNLPKDFFDYVLEDLQRKDTVLTEAIALDLMFVLLFASFETTSLAITYAIKILAEHPHILKELIDEHDAILSKRKNLDDRLTWKEYKSMKFTFQFINETARLANIVPGVFRKALKDIKFKGHTIPAGWAVMVCPPAVHLNPSAYKDPLVFNPWRWEDMEQKGASKNFMAFGGGMRFCVGTDFTKVQMAVFLHCLVTKYRFILVKGGDIVRTPGLQFPSGLHIKVSER